MNYILYKKAIFSAIHCEQANCNVISVIVSQLKIIKA